jgi:hypothetical protein
VPGRATHTSGALHDVLAHAAGGAPGVALGLASSPVALGLASRPDPVDASGLPVGDPFPASFVPLGGPWPVQSPSAAS